MDKNLEWSRHLESFIFRASGGDESARRILEALWGIPFRDAYPPSQCLRSVDLGIWTRFQNMGYGNWMLWWEKGRHDFRRALCEVDPKELTTAGVERMVSYYRSIHPFED